MSNDAEHFFINLSAIWISSLGKCHLFCPILNLVLFFYRFFIYSVYKSYVIDRYCIYFSQSVVCFVTLLIVSEDGLRGERMNVYWELPRARPRTTHVWLPHCLVLTTTHWGEHLHPPRLRTPHHLMIRGLRNLPMISKLASGQAGFLWSQSPLFLLQVSVGEEVPSPPPHPWHVSLSTARQRGLIRDAPASSLSLEWGLPNYPPRFVWSEFLGIINYIPFQIQKSFQKCIGKIGTIGCLGLFLMPITYMYVNPLIHKVLHWWLSYCLFISLSQRDKRDNY